MYTLREFRMNTKQAFDDANEGHEVVIKRGTQKFQLVSLVDKPLPGHGLESIPAKESRLKAVEKLARFDKDDWEPLWVDPKKNKL